MTSLPHVLRVIALVTFLHIVAGRFVNDNDQVLRTVEGHLYYVNSLSGSTTRLSRRDLENPSDSHTLRLDLESEGTSLEMNLQRRSVWTEDSRVTVRDGEQVEEVKLEVPTSCFMVGPLTELDGVASINYCDGMSGYIHTPGMDYLIEGQGLSDLEDMAPLKVTLLKARNEYGDDPADENMDDKLDEWMKEEDDFFSQTNQTKRNNDSGDGMNDNNNDGEEEDEPEILEAGCQTVKLLSRQAKPVSKTMSFTVGSVTLVKRYSSTACVKGSTFGSRGRQVWARNGCRGDFRVCSGGSGSGSNSGGSSSSGSGQTPSAPPSSGSGGTSVKPIAAEVAVYLDRNYLNALKSRGLSSSSQVTSFMINKWNTVASVYGQASKVGVAFDIQLKYIEIWWKNPSYYAPIQNDQSMSVHLRTFCTNTRSQNYDHRMLYTHGVGGNVAGLAYVGGICGGNGCSAVRSTTNRVRLELHEFGHNLGFPHEPQIRGCTTPFGFMGWKDTYKFSPCYKPKLLSLLKSFGSGKFQCLYRRNVNRPTLN